MTQSASRRVMQASRAAHDRAERLDRALRRLLWDSIADDAPCTCAEGDVCPQCEAMQALGYPRWKGAKDAEAKLFPRVTGRRRG